MDNFFKQFQDNLENRPEPPFEEKDWLALEKRLEPHKTKYPLSMWLIWMIAPLLLMSLAANGYFYNKMKNNDKLMAMVNSRIETVNSKTVVLQTDTIYKFQTIIERNTIYKTRILRETVVSYLPSNYNDYQKNNSIKTPINATENINDLQLKNNTFSLNSNDNLNDKKLNFNELEKIKLISLSFLKITKPTAPLELGDFPIIKNEHKTLSQCLEALRPKNYSLGISGGLLFPFGDGLSNPSGFKWGLEGAMFFSPNVSIWADAHYAQISYNVDKMSDAIGVPVVPLPDRTYTFNRAIIKQPTIQYMAGIRFRFDNPKRWQPYIGLGFGAVTTLPYEVGYEFKNNSLGTVWDVDLKVKRRGTQWGFLQFNAGFEKRLSKQYRWQIGADYRANLTTSDLQRHKLLGIKSSIMYNF